MTIEESKTVLTTHREHWERLLSEGICDTHEGKETISALTIALASLEAWEAVRQEINDLFSKPAYYIPNYDAYKMFLDIIDKHIKEVEE